jgi:hypothetical protein
VDAEDNPSAILQMCGKNSVLANLERFDGNALQTPAPPHYFNESAQQVGL